MSKITDKCLRILRERAHEGCNWMTTDEIARKTKIPFNHAAQALKLLYHRGAVDGIDTRTSHTSNGNTLAITVRSVGTLRPTRRDPVVRWQLHQSNFHHD